MVPKILKRWNKHLLVIDYINNVDGGIRDDCQVSTLSGRVAGIATAGIQMQKAEGRAGRSRIQR